MMTSPGVKLKGKRGGNRTRQTYTECKVCGQLFGPLDRLSRRFCSRECGYKGRVTNRKKGKHYPHLQRAETRSCEICKKPFRAIKDFIGRKQKYCSYECRRTRKGLITPENILARNSKKYQNWRISIFQRDFFTCQQCGDSRGGNLHAHHIFPFSKFHELRLSLNNGITLCKLCHELLHTSKKLN